MFFHQRNVRTNIGETKNPAAAGFDVVDRVNLF